MNQHLRYLTSFWIGLLCLSLLWQCSDTLGTNNESPTNEVVVEQRTEPEKQDGSTQPEEATSLDTQSPKEEASQEVAFEADKPEAKPEQSGVETTPETKPEEPSSVVPVRSCLSTFSHKPESPVAKLYVIGDWDWSKDTVMTDPDGDGVYSVSIKIPQGYYGYRFKLEDNQGKHTFTRDLTNSYRKYDGGVENSGLRVPDCKPPLLRKESFSLTGLGSKTVVKAEFAAFRGQDGSVLKDVRAVLINDFKETAVPPSQAVYERGRLKVDLKGLANGKYTLRIEAKDEAGRSAEPLLFPFWVEDKRFDWRDALLYMIMIDRFRDGDPSNNPKPAKGATPSADFFGGDLKGILKTIEEGYFEKLGIRALWLSPLSRNTETVHLEHGKGITSYHGYWPIKSREVDPRFGTADDLKAIIKAAHKRGIRVLFDYVINHVHQGHDYYKTNPSWFRTGCVCGTTSCDWTLRRLDCLFGKYMPDVNWENPKGGEAMIADALWWLEKFDADGLRVDAVKHVEDLAIFNLSARVNQRFEQGGTEYFLLGETAMGWGGHDVNSSQKEYKTISRYIGKDALNGQFDFVLYHAVPYRVFAYDEHGMIHVDYWTQASQTNYPKGSIMTPYISSHDTSRFVSQAMYRGQDSAHNKQVPSNKWAGDTGGLPTRPSTQEPYDRLRLAMSWLLGLPGAPLVYYGDEYGEYGGSDPDNRHMWRAPSQRTPRETAVFQYMQKLGQARQKLEPLRRGKYVSVRGTDNTLCFARHATTETVLVLLNRSSKAVQQSYTLPAGLPLPAGGKWYPVLGTLSSPLVMTNRTFSVTIPPRSAEILAPQAQP